ncbi:MAG TPA: hypothetical protein VMU50_20695 [Polyangia bacterium]|nr:hypothetical protein [Polyangia bacterium]
MLAGIPRSSLLFLIIAAAACSDGPTDVGFGPSRGASDPTAVRIDASDGDDSTAAADTALPPAIDAEAGKGGDSAGDAVAGGGGGGDGGSAVPAPDKNDGGGGGVVQDGGGAPPAAPCPSEPSYTGVLYGFAGGPNFGIGRAIGQCGFPNDKLPAGRFYGAVDTPIYAQAAACGACVRIESMDGKLSADVQIIDRVDPLGGAGGHVISADAAVHVMFGHGDNPQVRFHFVPCNVSGNIQVQFDATTIFGSSLMVMNHRNALAGVQVATAGGWRALVRAPFNRWPIPFTINGVKNSLRFLDGAGQSVDAADVPFAAGLEETTAQFPSCSATANDQASAMSRPGQR